MTAQLGIAFTGAVAIWLSQDTNAKRRRWACIFGLCGQPFWFYSAFTAEQWGIFAMCFLYTWSWLRGFRNNWVKPQTRLFVPFVTMLQELARAERISAHCAGSWMQESRHKVRAELLDELTKL